MPGLGGIEATIELKKLGRRAKVLILSQYEDREYVRRLLKAGVSGYVLKKSAGAELANAIRAVHRGGLVLDPEVARTAMAEGNPAAPGAATDPYDALTDREKQVLKLVAEGRSNKEVAEVLGHQREDRDEPPRARDGEARHAQPHRARAVRAEAGRDPGGRVATRRRPRSSGATAPPVRPERSASSFTSLLDGSASASGRWQGRPLGPCSAADECAPGSGLSFRTETHLPAHGRTCRRRAGRIRAWRDAPARVVVTSRARRLRTCERVRPQRTVDSEGADACARPRGSPARAPGRT